MPPPFLIVWGAGTLVGWGLTAWLSYRRLVEDPIADVEETAIKGIVLSAVWPVVVPVAAPLAAFQFSGWVLKTLAARARRRRVGGCPTESLRAVSPVEEAEEMAERLLEREGVR